MPTLPASSPHLTFTPHPSAAHPPGQEFNHQSEGGGQHPFTLTFPLSPAFAVIVLLTGNPSPIPNPSLSATFLSQPPQGPLELASTSIFWSLSVGFQYSPEH